MTEQSPPSIQDVTLTFEDTTKRLTFTVHLADITTEDGTELTASFGGTHLHVSGATKDGKGFRKVSVDIRPVIEHAADELLRLLDES